MAVLHKADQIKLFAWGKFCCHCCLDWLQPFLYPDRVWTLFLCHRRHTAIRLIHNNNNNYIHNHNKNGGEKSFEPVKPLKFTLSNPLIASWQNVYSTLSHLMPPVNGKAAADAAFCIKPLKPRLHRVVCLPQFDHADIFTSQEIPPQIYFGRPEDDRTLRE